MPVGKPAGTVVVEGMTINEIVDPDMTDVNFWACEHFVTPALGVDALVHLTNIKTVIEYREGAYDEATDTLEDGTVVLVVTGVVSEGFGDHKVGDDVKVERDITNIDGHALVLDVLNGTGEDALKRWAVAKIVAANVFPAEVYDLDSLRVWMDVYHNGIDYDLEEWVPGEVVLAMELTAAKDEVIRFDPRVGKRKMKIRAGYTRSAGVRLDNADLNALFNEIKKA